MRWFVLLCVVAAPGAFAGSLPGTQVSKLTLGAEPEFVPAPMPQPSSVNLTTAMARLVENQLQLLEFQKASLAGPAFTLVFAGLSVVTGAVLMIAFAGAGGAAVIAGFVVLMVSTLPIAIGVTWLLVNLAHNQRIDAAVQKLRDERKTLGAVSELPHMLELASF